MPCVQRSLYLKEGINNFDNIKIEVPEGVDSRTTVWLPAEEQQEQAM